MPPVGDFVYRNSSGMFLPEGDYQVFIDTEMIDGSLTIGEAVLQGESEQEVCNFNLYLSPFTSQ